jgi:hypothetical protein
MKFYSEIEMSLVYTALGAPVEPPTVDLDSEGCPCPSDEEAAKGDRLLRRAIVEPEVRTTNRSD